MKYKDLSAHDKKQIMSLIKFKKRLIKAKKNSIINVERK
jgi:hypothetical protein